MAPALGTREGPGWSWPTGCALLLVVASSYKWRDRDPTSAVSGAVDLATALEVTAYAAVGAFLLLRFGRGLVPGPGAPLPLLLLLGHAGLLVLSVTYSPYPSYAVVRGAQACVLAALATAVALHARREQLHQLARAFVLLVLVSVAYGVALPSEPLSRLQEGRFTWLAVHPTSSSVLTAIALVISVGSASAPGLRPLGAPGRAAAGWPRWAHAAAALVCAAALVASQTRASVLGAVVGAVVVVLLQQRGRRRLALLGTIAGAGGLLAYAGSAQLRSFLLRGEDAAQLATLNSRTDLWSVAWAAVLDEPLFGYGVGAARGIFYDATGLGGGHNAVVNLAVEVGALGVLVWTAMVVATAASLARPLVGAAAGRGDDRPTVLALLATLVVVGAFNDGPGAVANGASTWLWLLVAWSVVRRRGHGSGRPPAPAAALVDLRRGSTPARRGPLA